MLAAFLIMLREGLEAALVVGIIAGILRRTGRAAWLPLVGIGVAAAVLVSLGAGFLLDLLSAEFPQRLQELFEAGVGLVAVAMLTAMVFWMRRAAGSIRAELGRRVEAAFLAGGGDGSGNGREAALVGLVFLAVLREGLEAVFFLLAVFGQATGSPDGAPGLSYGAPLGAVAGLLAAAAAGWAISWGGVRLDLRRFFRWTGLLILLVAAGLLAGSVRALHEAGLWNHLQAPLFDLSGILPVDGIPGTVLSGLLGYQERPAVGEALAWALFLLATLPVFLSGRAARPGAAPSPSATLRPAAAHPGPSRPGTPATAPRAGR
ncbi:iron uptake transporter permease EfeU [Roseomonas elaeocarpi]|uniref:Iron uptake transporter permease EfeU n=1 Tax=Roseomonas elaeocarpi TaxID=907779 RepID=A0ABV6JME9_9PROT